MSQPDLSLNDLAEHALLPFVGRESEVQLIVDFWRSTILAERLRALIITGEAGSGKSRLLEAVIPIIAQQGGAVAHLKLYHDATAAIAPLVLESLRSSNLFRHVSRSGSGTPLSMAAQALRRIARLRPLLLVVEDIQLLEGEALQELNQLLEMMADEPISALFATRPVKQGARGIVERHLVDEITLGGLHRDGIAEMWRSVLGEPPAGEILDQLYHATLGNPLALRSAFREALKYRHATRDELPGLRDTPLPGELLQHALEHRVGLLAEGMVAHLDSRELRAATELASVGEVFARESAMALGSGIGEMLEQLQGKGIISVLTTPALPVGEVYSRYPLLAFSHSLIHNYLIRREDIDNARLATLIGAGAPLYSLLPFQLLLQSAPGKLPMLRFEELRRFSDCAISLVNKLVDGPDWRLASAVWQASDRLFRAVEDSLSAEERREMEVEICYLRVMIFQREEYSEDYEGCVRRFLELTNAPENELAGKRRLVALVNLLGLDHIVGRLSSDFAWNEAELALERLPQLIGTRTYVALLNGLASYMIAVPNAYAAGDIESMLARIERKLEIIEHSAYATDDLRRFARRKLFPLFLRRFNTPQELQSRMELREEMSREVNGDDWFFLMEELVLLESTGEIDELLRSHARWQPTIAARGLARTLRSMSFGRLRAMAMLGEDLGKIDSELAHFMTNPAPLPAPNRVLLIRAFALAGALCGEPDWSHRMLKQVPEARAILLPAVTVILARHAGDDAPLRELLEARAISDADREKAGAHGGSMPDPELEVLIAAMLGDAAAFDAAAVQRSVEAIAGAHLIRNVDVLRIGAMLSLVDEIGRRHPDRMPVAEITPVLQRALGAALDWSATRRLPRVVAMLLRTHSKLLSSRQRTLWNNRLSAITEERNNLLNADSDRPPITVTMIGTISVAKLRAEPHRLRGERMRVLLALMVANAIVAQQLPHEEFAAIATGIEDDPEAARLSLTHMVYRLRETIGTQAVLTINVPASASGAVTPQLNLATVGVDLIHVWRTLQTAHNALADGFLVKAARCLTEVIDTVGTEIIFPTLYDSFFEALRTDFEGSLHQLLLAIAGRLAEEGDIEGGEALLQRGFAMMPDDEEIAERLQEMLIRLERHADADRIRARAQRSLRG